jgi:DNA-binding SARP family transcriptional activator
MRLVMNAPGSAASRSAAPPTSARLLLRAAGQFALYERQAIDLEPKDALLLAYLAVEGPTLRGRLAALLWPEVDEERARGNLRQRLLRLKRTVGIELVTGNPLAQLAAGIEHDLVNDCDVLSSLELHQAGGMAEWLQTQRDTRRRARVDWLDAAVTLAETEGDLAAALEHANALVALEPLSEHAHRRVIRLHYLRGDAAAAIAAYERCRDTLRRELDAVPSKETEALRGRIAQAVVPATSALRPVPLSVLRPPRLIGRDAEWAALAAAWEQGVTAVVLGEAGLGKTRLVTDFARSRGPALVAAARPGDARVVYALTVRLLRQLPPECLRDLAPSVRKELARLLPELGEAAPILTEAERARFFNAVGAALAAARPAVQGVVIDDLHFADDASVELIRYLAADGGRPWIFAARPTEVGPQARALVEAARERSAHACIDLAPLTLPQMTELVESLGIEGLDATRVAATLMRQTGGNPLFALEAVKATLAAPGGASQVRLPAVASVAALVERRIGRLSPDAIRLARCAAIAGPDFSAELAATALGVRPLDLADAWAELEAAQVFRDGAFAHDLIHEAARASVPAPIARQLHRELAQYLAGHGGEPARIADHWLAAEQWDRAGAVLMEAARRSQAACRWREASQQLEQAEQCFERVGDAASRFEALYALSNALVYRDLGEKSVASARAALASAVTDEQRLRGAQALLEILAHRGDIDEVLAVGGPALALARARGDAASELRLTVRVGGCLSSVQRSAEALALLEPLQPWVDTSAEPHDRAEYYLALGFALDFASRLTEAVRALEAASQIARDAGLRAALADATSNLATAHAKLGRVRRAAELGQQALELMRGDETVSGRPLQTQALLAHRLRDAGRYAEALPLFEEALAHFRSAKASLWTSATAHRLALAWLQLGQYARAQRLLADDPGDPQPRSRAMWAACRAELARLGGPAQRGEALSQIRLALDTMKPWPDDGTFRVITLFATAIVAPEEGEPLATELAAWANARERFGLALGAHVRAAACALAQDAARRALPHVEAALRLAADFETDSMYRGELWLVAAQVYAAAGEPQLAERTLAEGCAWVRELAEHHVPAEFRDSFLNRNPVNRELLRLQSRSGRSAAA